MSTSRTNVGLTRRS
ncbi:unnamed protein product, partial [Vitis vinifera]|uniref:Uncharacterized protein n=1 Tax=Vitis vinifera TaxID=29760 RepID=D7SX54_VITVI